MKQTYGTIRDILPNGRVLIETTLPDDVDETEIRLLWQDRDEITAEQRKKVFSIVAEIAQWSAHDPEYVRRSLTADFLRQNIERLQMSALSLAISGNCDKGTASMYIDFLVNFCLENDVPTSRPLREYADDLERFTYSALLHRRCLICGRKADIHHCEGSHVGMGRNRKEMIHIGAELMPLCREHHNECHAIGQIAFDEKYHTKGVKADKRICQKVGLKYA